MSDLCMLFYLDIYTLNPLSELILSAQIHTGVGYEFYMVIFDG